MDQNAKLRIFTVVDVWRGMAVGAKSFTNLRNARNYVQRLERGRNMEEGDVQIFEDFVASSRVTNGAIRRRQPNSLLGKRT